MDKRQSEYLRAGVGAIIRMLLLLFSRDLMHGRLAPVLGWVINGAAQELAGALMAAAILLWSLHQKKTQQKLLDRERVKAILARSGGSGGRQQTLSVPTTQVLD